MNTSSRARDALHPWPTAAANEANDYTGCFYRALSIYQLLVSAVRHEEIS